MLAVAAPQARRAWIDDFVRRRYGSAPITVFVDPRGAYFNGVRRRATYPAHVFYSKSGVRIFRLGGYPFPATPRS